MWGGCGWEWGEGEGAVEVVVGVCVGEGAQRREVRRARRVYRACLDSL